jgi:signal peptidase I
MMSDEQSSPDRLADGSASPDLNGRPDPSIGSDGYRGALTGASGAGTGATGVGTGAIGAGEPGAGEPASTGRDRNGSHRDRNGSHRDRNGSHRERDKPGQDPSESGSRKAAAGKSRKSSWRELAILIVAALAIALVIKTFVVQPFFIPSSSMEDTLMIGDKVLVNKLVYHFRSIEPGDIIVFNGIGSWNPAPPPTRPASDPLVRAYDATLRPLFHSIAGLFGTPVGQTDYIKRVIGVPGDRVKCCNAQGLVTVNGIALHEQSYLYPGAKPSLISFNVVVPKGRLWVMGDNRAISNDSRLHLSFPGGGTIPENEVIGRAFVIVWPPSHWRILSIPSTFDQPGIDKPSSAAAARQAEKQQAAGAELLGAKLQPEPPYLPLAAGLVCAVPLTWLQRRARQRLAGRLRASCGERHH